MPPQHTEDTMTPLHVYHATHALGLTGLVPSLLLADDQPADAAFTVTWETGEAADGGRWARAEVCNTGTTPVALKGFRWGFDPRGAGGPALHFPAALRPHVYATENLRGDYFGTGTVEGDRFFYPLGNQPVEYGQAEEHLFPGLFIGAADVPVGLLVAQASQARLFTFFRFRGKMERQDRWLFEIEERVNGVTSLTLAPGERLRGETLFVQVVDTNDPQLATDAYFRLLRAEGAFARRAQNPLPTQRIYCTWNYDFFAEIDEEKLLAQLPILTAHFPTVKFVQLDDGYQTCHAPGQRAMIDLCYGDLVHPFDPARFPDGPKALAERIKAAGLRPAIWLGLWASTGSQMLTEHPDWILRDETGAELLFNKWYGGTAILDPSVPGVRDYLDRMCRTVFGEWGFAGVKLDFSSFAFNGKRVRYRYPGKTGVELRHELEGIFRRHLPADGFFGWCVVGGTAQPFLAQADYFRNAVDINKGDWPAVKRVAMWTANTDMLLQERSCLPNLDSIGWSEEFDETTWETWLNFTAVAGGALEVSGDLRKLDARRLARLARTLELSDPARRVRCLDIPMDSLALPPALWLAEGADGSRVLGLFNWADTPVELRLDRPALAELHGEWHDPWTGRSVSAAALPTVVHLQAHESLLLTGRA
jgi:hypothetical protein